MKKVTSFFFLLIIFPQLNLSSNIKISIDIDDKHYDGFEKIFKRICSEEFFFKNLASHQSYPSFGTIKDWKKVCKKVVENKINGFNLIRQNFTIKSLSPNHGLLTGYYEPEIKVSKIKTSKFPYQF